MTQDEPSALRWTARRIARHLRWARTEGIRRLIAEDRLDPVERVRTARAKRRWRRRHGGAPGSALPVYLVGLQRSGTNVLVRGLDAAPEVEVRNENDNAVFRRFRLRSDDTLTAVIGRSRHTIVLVKPLCDSHRAAELLALPTERRGRALWVWRDVDDRARSEVAKFGDANLRALRAIADGTIGAAWQGQNLNPEVRAQLRGFDYDRMDQLTAAALFWYARNELYFSLGLHERSDVLLCPYHLLVGDPVAAARRICAFLDLAYRPEFVADVAGGASRGALPIDPRVRALCDALTARLTAASQQPVTQRTVTHG